MISTLHRMPWAPKASACSRDPDFKLADSLLDMLRYGGTSTFSDWFMDPPVQELWEKIQKELLGGRF